MSVCNLLVVTLTFEVKECFPAIKAATEVGQEVLDGKHVIKSAISRGKQAVSDIAEAAANKVTIGHDRKKK